MTASQTMNQTPISIPSHVARAEKKHFPPKENSSVRYIDATSHIAGRLCSVVAEELLRGKKVVIVHAERAFLTGNPKRLTALWQTRLDLAPKGDPEKGPRFSRMPDRILRKMIEGMLPSRRKRGREALKRLRVHIGMPPSLTNQKWETIPMAAQPTKTRGVTTIRSLAESLGYSLLKETEHT